MPRDPRPATNPAAVPAAAVPAAPASRLTPAETALMAEFGITHETVDRFHVGAFRYGSLNDAVAEAKRRRNG